MIERINQFIDDLQPSSSLIKATGVEKTELSTFYLTQQIRCLNPLCIFEKLHSLAYAL